MVGYGVNDHYWECKISFLTGVVKLGNVRKTKETLPDFLQNV